MTLRRRLLLLVLSLVIPASLASASATYIAWSGGQYQARRTLQSTTRAVALMIDHRFSGMVKLLQALATSPFLTDGNLAAFRQQAIDAVHEKDIWVVLTAPSAQQLVNTLRPFGEPLPVHPYPDNVRKVIESRQPVISNLFIGPITAQYTIAVNVPVIRNDKVLYILGMGLRPTVLAKVLLDQNLPASWGVTIFDHDNTIAVRTRSPERFVGQPVSFALNQQLRQHNEGLFEHPNREGTLVVAAYSHAPRSGWGVIIGVPRTELMSSLNLSVTLVLAIGLALISMGLVFATVAARRIAGPIAALIGPAAALGRGETVPMIRHGLREVDEVAAALAAASALLQQRLDERNRAETALHRAKIEAEENNRAKSRFLAAASHDLRQPLMAANLFFESLTQRLPAESQGSEVQYLRKSLAAMNELLEVLFDLSQVDTGKIQVHDRDFPLGPLLDDLADAWMAMAGARGLDFRAIPARVMVHSDPALIKRILRNLLDNALKFTETGGILLGCRRRGRDIAIQVWDTGIGIPAAKLTQIFEEFYQVGNPGRDRNNGLGLGLSIVDRLARVLGHPVRVRSVEGRGSLFEIRLPLVTLPPADPRRLSRPLATGVPQWRGRVVVIDNDTLVLAGLKAIFEVWGCPTIIVTGPQAAWDELCRCPEPPVALILADHGLAEVGTGGDAILWLRARLGWPVPGVIMTGEAIDTLTEICGHSGFGLIQKPVTANRLLETLRAWIP